MSNTLWTNQPDPKGIHFRSTPSHGYVVLSSERLEQVPAVLKTLTQFYTGGNEFEEDCEWARVAAAFPQFWPEAERAQALEILERYQPEIFAEWTAQGRPTAQETPAPVVVKYDRTLKITNTEALPRGLKCKYLLALADHTGGYIAHSWKRTAPKSIPAGYVLIQF